MKRSQNKRFHTFSDDIAQLRCGYIICCHLQNFAVPKVFLGYSIKKYAEGHWLPKRIAY